MTMNVPFGKGLVAAVVAAALATGCEVGFEADDRVLALTNQEIEDDKELMCESHPCENEVGKETKWVHADTEECDEEYWTRETDTPPCDTETGTITTTYTYQRYVRNHRTPRDLGEGYEGFSSCEYTLTTWTVTEERSIADGEECEDTDDGDGGDGGDGE
jgi:hypothetical protein